MTFDWSDIFGIQTPPLEMIVRGTAMYWFLFALLRLAGRRDIGSLGMADLLVLVLVADAAGNAMSSNSDSTTDGMIVVATLIFWSVAVDRIGYFFPWTRRILEPDRVLLVRDGVIQKRGLRHEYITVDELLAELRIKGVDDVRDVRCAYMESDGEISVVRRNPDRNGQPGRRRGGPNG
ncbi:DUF421 domain-containing protein [Pigmentiphaga soli]